jgi:glutamate dehydrogenase/leucine dehydrogenase
MDVHNVHNVCKVEHGFGRSSEQNRGMRSVLTSVELSGRELGMIKLMADFFAEKPELTAKIESYTTAHYALMTTYSQNFGIPIEDSWQIFEKLQEKMNAAEYLQMEAPDPIRKWHSLSKEEMNMLRVLLDYFSHTPKMSPESSFAGTRKESIIEIYKWFFGTTEGNGEYCRECYNNLIQKTQSAIALRFETLAPVVATPNPYEAVLKLLQIAGDRLKLEPGIQEMLKRPMRTIIVNIPTTMDDGSIRVFTGYRVQYNDVLGPTKGGIRYHPDLTLDEVIALSAWMTLKTAVMGLPLGGGKGGIRCNPKQMSYGELERLTRGYTRALARFIGPQTDVPAPDVYTDAQTMAWIMDEYSQIVGYNAFGVVTGKPVDIGGCQGRNEATSRGLIYTVVEAAKHLKMDLRKATVVVQGFGNVGFHAAKLLNELGCKIIAVSDSSGGIYDPKGLDPVKVQEYKNKTGSVAGYRNCRSINNEDLLELQCDILVPAALENQITISNAQKIKAKIMAEGANGPTTPEADEILFRNDVFVIPDVLANSGGVVVSYFEQVQNQMNYYWTEDEVRTKLEHSIVTAFNEILRVSKKYDVDMRIAAYMNAVKRIADAMSLRNVKTFPAMQIRNVAS